MKYCVSIVASPVSGQGLILPAFLSVLLAGAILLVLGTPSAKAGQFPQCNDVPVEKRIIRDFAWADKHTWFGGVVIVSLSKMHEHRSAQQENSPVARRYCMATAHFSNGGQAPVYYLIENIGGFVASTWNVTHCVPGLDHWRNHDGLCQALR
jgi:hypothetical protein